MPRPWWDASTQRVSPFAGAELISDHPFTIVSCRGMNPKTYFVRYGLSTQTIPPSPLAEKAWHTAAQIKLRMNVSPETVDSAIKLYRYGGRQRLGVSQVSQIVEREWRGDALGSSTARCILAILDRDMYRPKAASKHVVSRWRIRWRNQMTIHDEWIDRYKMNKLFGAEEAKEAVQKYINGHANVREVVEGALAE